MRYELIYTDRSGNKVVEQGRGTADKTRKKCYRMIRSGVTRYIRIHNLGFPENEFSEVWAGHGKYVYYKARISRNNTVWRINPSDGRINFRVGTEEP